jgi:hypothetical protein
MKKPYSQLSINEKINLKHNHDLGERHEDNYSKQLGKSWKGPGAIRFLSRFNPKFECKNFNVAVTEFEDVLLIRNNNNRYVD